MLVLISGSGAAVNMPGVEQLVPVLLGVRLFIANVMQFVVLIYYILLLLYAIRLKPEADLHSCVVNGRVEQLKALLSVPDVGLDMNRHGPQGRGGHGRRGQPRRRYPPRQRLGPAAAQRCQIEHAAYTR